MSTRLLAAAVISLGALACGAPADGSITTERAAISAAALGATHGTLYIARNDHGAPGVSVRVELSGSDAVVTWPELKPGRWVLVLTLRDAADQVVFTGRGELLWTPSKPMPSAVPVSGGGESFTIRDKASALLFWNTLDDASQTVDSAVGVSGEIVGDVTFAPVKFGDGIGNFPDSATCVKYDGLFGRASLEAWTVELWVDWGNLARSNMSLFTVQGEPDAFGVAQFYVPIAQSEAGPGLMIRDYGVVVQWSGSRYLEAIWRFQESATAPAEHLAVSVDLSAPGGQRIRLYRDGVEQGPPSWADLVADPQGSFAFPEYVRIGQSVAGNPWVLGAYVDNLEVWSYAKSDFSDRLLP